MTPGSNGQMGLDRTSAHERPPRRTRPRARALALQVLVVLVCAALLWSLLGNPQANLAEQGIRARFEFWIATAGFNISQALMPFREGDSYGRAFLVGMLTTLLISGLGIALATLLGFLIGISGSSPNDLLSGLCRVYVESTCNTPLLLHTLFICIAVLKPLPDVAGAVSFFDIAFLSNRGLQIAWPQPVQSLLPLGLSMLAALVISILILRVGVTSRVFKEGALVRRFAAACALPAVPIALIYLSVSRARWALHDRSPIVSCSWTVVRSSKSMTLAILLEPPA